MVSDKPCGNIGTCPEEEALPEGDLAGIPNDNLQTEDRDGVGDRFIQADQREIIVIRPYGNRSYINVSKSDQKEGDDEKGPFCYLVISFRCEPADSESL